MATRESIAALTREAHAVLAALTAEAFEYAAVHDRPAVTYLGGEAEHVIVRIVAASGAANPERRDAR